MRPTSVCHNTSPSKSSAASPRLPSETYTRSPSVVGVADAGPFFWCAASGGPGATSVSQRSAPSLRR